jgi:hypothetical protein
MESDMKTEYTIFKPGDGAVERGEVDWPKDPGYHLIKALVEPLFGGDPLEHVSVLHDGRRRDMFVSEYGHMRIATRDPMPRNERATAIYRTNWMTQHPDQDPESLPTIAGPAILFYRIVWT